MRYNPETGELVDNSTWHYKVPTCLDVPADLRTEFFDSGHNPAGVLGSKATGEPSVLAGCSVMFALRMAITSARADAGITDWFQLGTDSILIKSLPLLLLLLLLSLLLSLSL